MIVCYKRYHTVCNVLGPICKACILKWYATDVCVIGLLPLYTVY